MKTWFTCSELCNRLGLNKYDIRELVIGKKLKVFDNNNFTEIDVDKGVRVDVASWDNLNERRPYTLREIEEFIYHLSDVEEYERENGIGILVPSIDPQQINLVKAIPDTQPKLLNKLAIQKPRKSIAYDEATKLHRDNPLMDKVKAKKIVDVILQKHDYPVYKRTQFNRIIKDIGFPPAPRGRKPAKQNK